MNATIAYFALDGESKSECRNCLELGAAENLFEMVLIKLVK